MRSSGRLASLLFASCSLAFLTPLVHAQGIKLNGPLARPIGGDIREFQVSPDGTRVVYAADQDTNDVIELYSARADGRGVPLKLSAPMVSGGSVDTMTVNGWRSFQIGARSDLVVYAADQEVDGVVELFAVPLKGGPVVKLNLDGMRVRTGFRIAPDETRAVYLASSLEIPNRIELFSAPIGGGIPVRLNPALVNSRKVSAFRISAHTRRVVYRADQDRQGVEELYGVSIDGGHVSRLSPEHWTTQDVGEFEIDPTGRHVVFAFGTDLYVSPLTSGGPPRLLNRMGTWASSFQFTADGKHVVFQSWQPQGSVAGLGAVSLDPAAGSRFDVSFPPGRLVRLAALTPDGREILLNGNLDVQGDFELYRLAIDGSGVPVRLSEGAGMLNVGSVQVSPDSRRVVWVQSDGIFSTAIDGGSAPLRIAPPQSNLFSIAPTGDRVVFVSWTATDSELWSVPIAGGAEPVRLNAPLPSGGDVGGGWFLGVVFQITADGRRVLYYGDQVVDEEFELFTVPADGSATPRPVSGRMPIGGVEGDVTDFELAPDGTRAVYVADQDVNDRFELFSVPTSGEGKSVRLHEPLGPGEYVQLGGISPDGTLVVYGRQYELYAVPIGGGPSIELSGSLITDLYERVLFTPDGSRIVFEGSSGTTEAFFSVALDGSTPPVQISPWQNRENGLDEVDITPDGQTLLYLADPGPQDWVEELFATRVDGSSPSVLLSTPHVAGGRIVHGSVVLSPDARRVLYIADHETRFQYELYSVPVDGSASPLRLNAPSFAALSRVIRVQVAGAQAFYVGDQEADEVIELYRVPIDGSAPPLKLNAALLPNRDVTAFRVSPDASRVVYQADHQFDEIFGIYSVPSDASSPPVAVNGAIRSFGAYTSYPDEVITISPDGSRVFFVPDVWMAPGVSRLYGAPIDGGTAPVLLHDAFIGELQFTENGRHLLHLGFVPESGVALFRTPVDRAGASRRVSGFGTTFYGFEEYFHFEQTPDARVAYLLDQESDGVIELFLGFLTHPRGLAPDGLRATSLTR